MRHLAKAKLHIKTENQTLRWDGFAVSGSLVMSLRALFALLVCAFAFFGGAGAFEVQALHDNAGDECGECCCETAANQDACCATPTRGGQASSAQHSPTTTTTQAAQLKARRAPTRAEAVSLFYALLLTATKPGANAQALARATADPALATPTPALRVTQCRWLL